MRAAPLSPRIGKTPFRLLNSESVEEYLSMDSSSTMVSRRRYSNKIISSLILSDQIICLVDNGILELFRYGLTESASISLNHLRYSSIFQCLLPGSK